MMLVIPIESYVFDLELFQSLFEDAYVLLVAFLLVRELLPQPLQLLLMQLLDLSG
jgi:hypothetical protein